MHAGTWIAAARASDDASYGDVRFRVAARRKLHCGANAAFFHARRTSVDALSLPQ
jgi:hypothetical protein